ncbi:MAG: MBOAT family O-acyltransferase [Eubacteriales bacterium]
MSLISLSYFVFITLLAAIYYLTPLQYRWGILCVGSIFFYLQLSTPLLLLCTLFMIGVAYIATNYLIHTKHCIPIAITLELIIWGIFQTNTFFVINSNRILRLIGSDVAIQLPNWVAPLGISYFTLLLVGYILDVSWGKSTAEKNPFKLLLFTTFFPQTVTGPITRYDAMSNQLFMGQRFNYLSITFGVQRIIWGLFKKLVIAERLNGIVTFIYSTYETLPGFVLLLGMFAYTLQMYMDFSASMDIVIGTGQLFGITLPENFQTPFFSKNLSELWRRWHMTLGFWVKDYLLYPTLKSNTLRKLAKYTKKKFNKQIGKQIPTYLGMLVTWSFVGFWHGGSWKFIFGSGLFFFCMIVGGLLLEPLWNFIIKYLQINTNCFSYRLYQSTRTFVLFSVSIAFVRASSAREGLLIYYRVITEFFSGLQSFDMLKLVYNEHTLSFVDIIELIVDYGVILLICIAAVLLMEILQQKYSIRESLDQQNLPFRWCIWILLIFTILILGHYGPGYSASEFIYGGF